MMKRRKQQIPKRTDVCVLDCALSPRYGEPQKLYLTYPAAAGLPLCLIDIPHSGSIRFVGAPVVLSSEKRDLGLLRSNRSKPDPVMSFFGELKRSNLL